MGELLPAKEEINYELEAYQPILEQDNEQATTISDLSILNNHLAMCTAALPNIRTIGSLCMLSATVCKLIETRRKVKKLPFGDGNKGAGRVFEVIE